MADLPIAELNHLTPLAYAQKPTMDMLTQSSRSGLVKTIPDGMEPGSGPANMSVMGYDPEVYYTGRSPLEAVSLGLSMALDDMVFRCNLVTLKDSGDGRYNHMIMEDYSAGEISSEEAAQLISAIENELGSDVLHFYPGTSYRHCLIWQKGTGNQTLIPPHDIADRPIAPYLPSGEDSKFLCEMMEKSYKILNEHPVNQSRRARGLRPANSIWLWGQGTKPALANFADTYHKSGAVISAVDLIYGLALCAGLKVIKIPGATGNLHTDFAAKGRGAIEAFQSGIDYVYVHVEAPDECGHQGDVSGKVSSIEKIDHLLLKPVYDYLENQRLLTGEDYKILVLPDHPTPIATRTHSADPVPFFLYESQKATENSTGLTGATPLRYSEEDAKSTGIYFPTGPALFQEFIT